MIENNTDKRIENLHFKIDGEYVTDLVRDMFWNDDRSYEECEEFLFACLVNDDVTIEEKKQIIIDILEGRKKFVGINTFTLEDDNENIRPIYQKLEEVRKKYGMEKIKNDIHCHPLRYVDPYSTVKSLSVAKGTARNIRYQPKMDTIEDLQNYFWYSDSNIDHGTSLPYDRYDRLSVADCDTHGGLWLLDYPDVIYNACKGDLREVTREEFWDNVYESIKDDSRFQSYEFKERNNMYLALNRVKEVKDKREEIQEKPYGGYFEKKKELCEEDKKNLEYAKNMLSKLEEDENDVKTLLKIQSLSLLVHVLEDKDFARDDNIEYRILPDDISNWEGLISPNGEFYSCTFGGHNVKAYHIICTYPERFPEVDFEDLIKHEGKVNSENALDSLLMSGWCATRNLPYRGNYICTPEDVNSTKRVTKAQRDKIFEAIVLHDVKCDTSKIM